jgi:hypothetical protein
MLLEEDQVWEEEDCSTGRGQAEGPGTISLHLPDQLPLGKCAISWTGVREKREKKFRHLEL